MGTVSTSGRPVMRDPGGTAGAPAQPQVGIIVAVGVWTSALALGPLFTTSPWWPTTAWTSLAVVAAGAVTRPRSRAAAPFAQLAALVMAITVAFLPGTAWFGVIPTPASAGLARELTAEAATTIATNPAPAPGTPGVAFAITLVLTLVVIAADTVAATLRRPLLAAIPLLLPSLTTVAVSGNDAPWASFAGPALALAALLYVDRSVAHRPHLDPAGQGIPPQVDPPVRQRPTLATAVALGAVVVATLAGALPTMTTYAPPGGGRGGGQSASVGFSPDPDLITDLRSDDPTPVLTYRTQDGAPPPLRVSVAERYADGRWAPTPVTAEPTTTPDLPYPSGLTVDVTQRTLTVTRTRLEPPYLAAPTPLVGGTVTGARWAQDPVTGVLVVGDRPERYEMTYVVPAPGIPDPTGDRAGPADLTPDDLDTSSVTPAVRAALREATRGARTDLERAAGMEDWLRDETRFTYSLDLPQPPGGDPVETFLRTRTGYCTHFATTMVLMARELGIPARLATGFLPGTVQGEERVVRADDAHAWPELYLAGYGWTRYEPTPSVRTGAPAGGPRPVPTDSPEEPTLSPTTRPTATPERRNEPTEAGAADQSTGTDDGGTARLTGAPLALGLLLLGAVVASPALARARHARRLRRAGTPAGRIDEHWAHLERRLSDLGVTAAPEASVRARGAAYRSRLDDPDAQDALDRLVTAVEAGRYRPPSSAPDDAAADRSADDAHLVARAARTGVSPRIRRRARLWPSDGLASLRRRTR